MIVETRTNQNHRPVLMTVDAVGGVWTFAMELCRGLREWKFILACMGPVPDEARRAEIRMLPNVHLAEHPGRLEWMDHPWDDVEEAGEWLLGLEAAHRPELIHLNGYAHAPLPWKAPVLVTAHSCVLSWWKAVKKEEAPASWSRYAEAVRAGLSAADLVVAPSRPMADSLIENYKDIPKVEVIYNGRRGRRPQAAAKEPFILSAGRLWDDAKNIRSLTGIAADLPWRVVLAGNATSPDGHVPELPNVLLAGHLPFEEMAGYYDRASIYVLPALYEPFGLSVLEAALGGCALVLGDIPTLREIWADAAIFVDPCDSRALLRVLTRLIGDANELGRLGRLARERAFLYSAARMAGAYSDAYEELARRAVPLQI